MPRSPSPRRAARTPLVERLEDRQLLSAARDPRVAKPAASVSAAVSTAKGHHPWQSWLRDETVATPGSKAGPAGKPKFHIDLRASDILAFPDAQNPPPGAFTPAELSKAYGVNLLSEQGQGMTIAIVDPNADPRIASDANTFSRTFDLPLLDGQNGDPTLTIAQPDGRPLANVNNAFETALDVEWVHAIAPEANILLVESLNFNDILRADIYAARQPGVSVVSNSWSGGEYSGERSADADFLAPSGHAPVAFTFSSGDSGAPGGYPAYSPNVVAIGGTTLAVNAINGTYSAETGWSGSGGGISAYEPSPSFQSGLGDSNRAIPDVSSDADPNTGVAVYDSFLEAGWYQVGGTSVSAPTWAAIIALGDQARIANGLTTLSSAGVNAKFYGTLGTAAYASDFHDVTTGNNGFAAGQGYDLVTGVGTPKAPQIVSLLSSS